MSEQFEIGEIAIYWNPGTPNHRKEVTVLSEAREIFGIDSMSGEEAFCMAYRIEESSDWVYGPYARHLPANVPVSKLRKRRPPQELGSWDECVWKPKHLDVRDMMSPKKQYETAR